jgi:hypothetical protein
MSGARGQSAINPVRAVNGRCWQVRTREVRCVDHLNLFIAADLTPEERAEFERRYRERVDDWRPILAGPTSATDRLTKPDFGAPQVPA